MLIFCQRLKAFGTLNEKFVKILNECIKFKEDEEDEFYIAKHLTVPNSELPGYLPCSSQGK